MRLDKYLKVSRIVKRRCVAKEIVNRGLVKVNNVLAKNSKNVEINDVIEIHLGNELLTVSVLEIFDGRTANCKSMYRIVSKVRIGNDG